jgi:hypothetical protein
VELPSPRLPDQYRTGYEPVTNSPGIGTTRGLACVEQTRMAIGVFGDMDLAVEAAEMAMPVDECPPFQYS